jgi:hypothetical protein
MNNYTTTPKGRRCLIAINYYGTARCEVGKLTYAGIKVAEWSYYDNPRTYFNENTLIEADKNIDKYKLSVEED